MEVRIDTLELEVPVPEVSVEIVRELGGYRKQDQAENEGPHPDDYELCPDGAW